MDHGKIADILKLAYVNVLIDQLNPGRIRELPERHLNINTETANINITMSLVLCCKSAAVCKSIQGKL